MACDLCACARLCASVADSAPLKLYLWCLLCAALLPPIPCDTIFPSHSRRAHASTPSTSDSCSLTSPLHHTDSFGSSPSPLPFVSGSPIVLSRSRHQLKYRTQSAIDVDSNEADADTLTVLLRLAMLTPSNAACVSPSDLQDASVVVLLLLVQLIKICSLASLSPSFIQVSCCCQL